jgi:hypothetical protein
MALLQIPPWRWGWAVLGFCGLAVWAETGPRRERLGDRKVGLRPGERREEVSLFFYFLVFLFLISKLNFKSVLNLV